ncbi:MAG: hypothetical protein GXW99_12105, partial [Clostridiales bacterium]|nr:hypothetical protein [Clostridiales bacterium]
MDKKDQIILQQLEVIRTMTEKNLKNMGSDCWGAPPATPTADHTPPGPEKSGGILDIPEKNAPQQ